jgi:hypothetical protein
MPPLALVLLHCAAAGGAQSGRAAAAEKQLERMRAEGLVEKPFVPKRRAFTFPPVEKMGASVLSAQGLSHGYGGRLLFKDVQLELGPGERVAIIGPNGCASAALGGVAVVSYISRVGWCCSGVIHQPRWVVLQKCQTSAALGVLQWCHTSGVVLLVVVSLIHVCSHGSCSSQGFA